MPRLTAAALAPLLALLLGLAAPGTALAQAESREGIFLQNEILQLRQEVETLRRGGAVAAPAPASRGNAPAGEMVGTLLDRVARMEEEQRSLRGRLEESENRNRSLTQQVEKLQGDLDFRLQQLEGQAGGAAAAPAGRPATPPPAAAPPARPPAAATRPPERAIADGQAALARRDYALAEAAAREVLANRNSPRATDAQLLLGEALAGKRDHANAALAFNDAYGRARTGPRAPDALLGLAGAFTSLGNRREACDTLDDLRSNFPSLRGTQAERAVEARRRAGCRG